MLKIVSKDEKKRMIYDARQAEIMDKSSMLKQALRKGELKGELKGEKKGRLEIARNMIAENEPMEKIIKYSGLSKEEIAKLQN